MAIVQISRITNRKGLTENLPQLAGAELGWCIDSRRLFIGNGTLEDGAPVIGNTEILTEFSDITVLSDYTYQDVAVGYAAQTGPTLADPIVRSVQAKLDDFANVRDFGAVGDGVADDTLAINRALYQLYCRETNTQVRRTLYFPAGTYRVTETINIPSFAKLVGDGANGTIILLDTSADLSSLSAYVARYADSLQQIGANIGNNGAIPPTNIEISGITFQSLEVTDVFYVEDANQCWFQNVNFIGSLTNSDIIDPGFNPGITNVHAVAFRSVTAAPCNQITFDQCQFSNCTYAFETNEALESITVTNSKFLSLYQGVVLTGGNPMGVRILHSIFDDIYYQGINFEDVSLNVSGYNLFLNVGYGIVSSSPLSSCVNFGSDQNVSVNDLFQRSDSDTLIYPRITVNSTSASSGGTQLQLGTYARLNGCTATLTDNSSNQTIFTVSALDVKAFRMDYTIVRGVGSVRHGTMIITNDAVYSDEYTENGTTGVTLSCSESTDIISVKYTTTSTGDNAILTYSIAHLA